MWFIRLITFLNNVWVLLATGQLTDQTNLKNFFNKIAKLNIFLFFKSISLNHTFFCWNPIKVLNKFNQTFNKSSKTIPHTTHPIKHLTQTKQFQQLIKAIIAHYFSTFINLFNPQWERFFDYNKDTCKSKRNLIALIKILWV